MADLDREETQQCVICGEELDPEDERDFWFSASTVACYECARRLGGVYDPALEKWQTPPRLPTLGERLPQED